MSKKYYTAIGLMSGSSLDGLDIAYCTFEYLDNGQWHFDIEKAECMVYTKEWVSKLSLLPHALAKDFWQTHIDFGHYLGELTKIFIKKYNLQPDLVASHGHTIFHSPQTRMTAQIGDGATIAQQTGVVTVCDFRSSDIANFGQGAPIVPITDKLLFSQYNACLNLGGIANISVNNGEEMLAFDICPMNQIFNYLANKKDLPYDDKGNLARKGKFNIDLFDELNDLDYYQKNAPKSMANGWIREQVLPIVEHSNISIEDKLNTFVQHACHQFEKALAMFNIESPILTTGGGARNTFFVEQLRQRLGLDFYIPHNQIVDYKEALAMAFLGVLRIRKESNVLSSVTGAKTDTIGGAVYLPAKDIL